MHTWAVRDSTPESNPASMTARHAPLAQSKSNSTTSCKSHVQLMHGAPTKAGDTHHEPESLRIHSMPETRPTQRTILQRTQTPHKQSERHHNPTRRRTPTPEAPTRMGGAHSTWSPTHLPQMPPAHTLRTTMATRPQPTTHRLARTITHQMQRTSRPSQQHTHARTLATLNTTRKPNKHNNTNTHKHTKQNKNTTPKQTKPNTQHQQNPGSDLQKPNI